MTTIVSNASSKLTITTGDQVSESRITTGNMGTIATSNGSLIRILYDTGRVEFAPIVLIGATHNQGDVATNESDEIVFTQPQAWVLISHNGDKIFS